MTIQNKKINVRLIEGYLHLYTDINRYKQTPKSSGVWNNVHFSSDAAAADYVVILNWNHTTAKKITCPLENVWVIIQEPYTLCLGTERQ